MHFVNLQNEFGNTDHDASDQLHLHATLLLYFNIF